LAPRPIKVQWTDKETGKSRTRSFSKVDTARKNFERKKQSDNDVDVILSMPIVLFAGIEVDDLEDDFDDGYFPGFSGIGELFV